MAKGPEHAERSFGLSVGAVTCVIGVVLFWKGRLLGAEVAGAIGVLLLAGGLFAPQALRLPSAIWWRFARIVGYINAHILLTLLFALVLTPLSLIWRAIGKDPLERRRDRFHGWSPYPARYRDTMHYTRMY